MFYRVMRVIFWLAFWSALAAAAFYGWQGKIFLLNSFLLSALGLLVLYLIQNSAIVKKYYNESFGNTMLGLAGLIFFTTSLGTFYFYYYIKFFEYDLIAHTIIPASFVIMAAMLYEIGRIKKIIPGKIEVILISSIPVLLLSFFWEFFQMQGDVWWGTQMFSDSNQNIVVDVANDLSADTLGVFIGCVLIFKNWEKWNKKWLKK